MQDELRRTPTIDLWVGARTGFVASQYLDFYLVHLCDEGQPQLVECKEALDRVYVQFNDFGLRMDTDRNGTINTDDEPVEETLPGALVLVEPGRWTSLQVLQIPEFDQLDQPTVKLRKAGAGVVVVTDSAGSQLLGEQGTEVNLDPALLVGGGVLGLRVTGVAPGSVSFDLELVIGNQLIAHDRLVATVLSADARVFNGLAQFGGGQMLVSAEEVSPGALTVANWNDTDGDGVPDFMQGDPTTVVQGECDLAQLTLMQPNFGAQAPIFTNVRLRVSTLNAVFWSTNVRTDSLMAEGSASVSRTWDAGGADFANGQLDVWVEVTEYPTDQTPCQNVKIFYEAEIGGSWVELDRVSLTGLWFEANTTWLNDGDLSVPAGVRPQLLDFIEASRSKGAPGQRYGDGPFLSDWRLGWHAHLGAHDNFMLGGRILLSWRALPIGVREIRPGGTRICCDSTRCIRELSHSMTAVSQGLTLYAERAWGNHPDVENDDRCDSPDSNTWEDDFLDTKDVIFAMDTPGNRRYLPLGNQPPDWDFGEATDAGGDQLLFNIGRFNARAFVRVVFGGETIDASDPTGRQGSRTSMNTLWHWSSYGVRGNDGKLHEAAVAEREASAVVVLAGNVSGNLVGVVAAGDTQRYQATFWSLPDVFVDGNGNNAWDPGEQLTTDWAGDGDYDVAGTWSLEAGQDVSTVVAAADGSAVVELNGVSVTIPAAPNGGYVDQTAFTFGVLRSDHKYSGIGLGHRDLPQDP